MTPPRFALALTAAALLAAPAAAGPTVSVAVGPDAPKLERFAADELAALFKTLFDADAKVGTAPAAADHLILVGSPATNPAVKAAAGDAWPKLTDQGHLLRSAKYDGKPALLVGGGSPVATLWAAYELAHHFGVRPFLHGDLLPAEKPALKLDDIDGVLEPITSAKTRAWRVLGDSPTGFGGWGLADHKRLFAQLAKLKFNRVVVDPPKADWRFPVAGDTPGRKAFAGAKAFANPDLDGKGADARAALAKDVTAAAAEFGMTATEFDPAASAVAFTGFLPRAWRPETVEFVVFPELPGDLTPGAYAISRGAFDLKFDRKDTTAQLLAPVLGKLSAERVALGFKLLDDAESLVTKMGPGFATPTPDMILKQLKSADPPPAWWKEAGKQYAGAMDEMYRGLRATFNVPARDPLLRYAKRCEFAVHWFVAVEAARLAGNAKAKGDKEARVEQLEKAVESTYNALTALGDVARDPSDRGLIAVLAEYAYRPLKAELKAADNDK